MHELGMCQAVLDAVEKRAAGRPVVRIGVRVGADLAVLPDVFDQGFRVLAQGSVADGAGVEVDTVDGDGLTLVWIEYREDPVAPVTAKAATQGHP